MCNRTHFYSCVHGDLYCGDSLAVLKRLPSESANCCVTSPPYFGLRDYGVDGQIGLEETPEDYVANLVEVFREVRRVLRDDGTLWLNLGDSYAAQRGGTHQPAETLAGAKHGKTIDGDIVNRGRHDGYNPTRNASAIGLKHKDLIGIPWRVAFALQADGWFLRQDIIWHKPNPMPESVRDRCTKAHEYVFLLSKSDRYFYDHVAIKEPAVSSGPRCGSLYNNTGREIAAGNDRPVRDRSKEQRRGDYSGGRNRRSVWTVATRPYKGAHFAVFPPQLVEPCILAGCPIGGVVLDPFFGSGTTGMVARKLRRKWIGIDINEQYCGMALDRIDTKSLSLVDML